MELTIPADHTLDTAAQLHQSTLRLLRVSRTGRPVERTGTAGIGVLGCLYRQGQLSATDLAAYLRVQPQSLTRLIAGLEKQKLISRLPDSGDKRRSLLEITDAGAGLLKGNIHGRRELLAQAIARGLTPTEQELLRIAAGLMDKLAAAVEDLNTAAARPEPHDDRRK